MARHRAPDTPRDLDDGGAYFLAAALFLICAVGLLCGIHLL